MLDNFLFCFRAVLAVKKLKYENCKELSIVMDNLYDAR